MRPLLAPDAFVRTYLGATGRFWVVVRAPGRERLRIDAETRALVELCNGARTSEAVARAADERVARRLTAWDVERKLQPLVDKGALVDLDAPPPPRSTARPPPNLRRMVLDDETAASLRVVPSPSTGLGCHGRGGCCGLYDRLRLDPGDAARIAHAFAGELTPGGLSVESALGRERADEEIFNVAVNQRGCVLLEADGGCGVHRRLGAAGKPDGCRTFPLRDVRCGDELHVGLAVECRCSLDFADDDPAGFVEAANALFERRQRTRILEEVADEVTLAPDRVVSRADYALWRAAALEALGECDDVVEWALSALPAVEPPLEALQRWLAFEAADTAALYDPGDLQRQVFAWADAAARRLPRAHPPVDGERFAARQLVFAHGLLRSPTVADGLASLALRLQLARAGAALPMPPELLPVVTVEYLGRVYGLGRIFG